MRPNRIYFIRHGESNGNVDRSVYETTPDWKIELTKRGEYQSMVAGKILLDQINDTEKLGVYVSPLKRTVQTWENMKKSIPDDKIEFVRQDPRLREQEWGNLVPMSVQEELDKQREAFGPFFFRMPTGESGADVYDRATDFLSTVYRDFHHPGFPKNMLVVTHGFTLRALLMRWLHLTVDQFHSMRNPHNCEMFYIEQGIDGKFHLPIPFPTKPDPNTNNNHEKCSGNTKS